MPAGNQFAELVMRRGEKIGADSGRAVEGDLDRGVLKFNVDEFDRDVRMKLRKFLSGLNEPFVRTADGFPDFQRDRVLSADDGEGGCQ